MVGHFFPGEATPEEAAQRAAHVLAIEEMIKARDVRLLETQQAVMVAELQQSDNYTKRLRPTIGYALTLLIMLNYLVLPMAGRVPVDLPDQFWYVYTGLLSVYFVGRSYEKINASKHGASEQAPSPVARIMGLVTGR